MKAVLFSFAFLFFFLIWFWYGFHMESYLWIFIIPKMIILHLLHFPMVLPRNHWWGCWVINRRDLFIWIMWFLQFCLCFHHITVLSRTNSSIFIPSTVTIMIILDFLRLIPHHIPTTLPLALPPFPVSSFPPHFYISPTNCIPQGWYAQHL